MIDISETKTSFFAAYDYNTNTGNDDRDLSTINTHLTEVFKEAAQGDETSIEIVMNMMGHEKKEIRDHAAKLASRLSAAQPELVGEMSETLVFAKGGAPVRLDETDRATSGARVTAAVLAAKFLESKGATGERFLKCQDIIKEADWTPELEYLGFTPDNRDISRETAAEELLFYHLASENCGRAKYGGVVKMEAGNSLSQVHGMPPLKDMLQQAKNGPVVFSVQTPAAGGHYLQVLAKGNKFCVFDSSPAVGKDASENLKKALETEMAEEPGGVEVTFVNQWELQDNGKMANACGIFGMLLHQAVNREGGELEDPEAFVKGFAEKIDAMDVDGMNMLGSVSRFYLLSLVSHSDGFAEAFTIHTPPPSSSRQRASGFEDLAELEKTDSVVFTG